MPGSPVFPLKVFYDGSCSVCATEIRHYGKKDREGRLELIDISAPDFTPDRFGIGLGEFMYQLHAIDQDDKLYRGPEAFWAIWQAFPTSTLFGMLGVLITLPGVSFLARLVYRGFARSRKYLPKRKVAVCKIGKVR